MPGNAEIGLLFRRLVKRLRGKVFGDRGSISAPFTQLLTGTRGKLITWLLKRATIEVMINQFRNISETLAFSEPSPDQLCRPFARLCLSPTAIKTKSQTCISINTLSWLLGHFHVSITHVEKQLVALKRLSPKQAACLGSLPMIKEQAWE